eukprot:CAMPEP_0203680750 /NCGR_PEP_ID=MMETSP0090-20130426/40490_1 /ASSEMBLY_ACC=CAM_ASM_001088 /TAXON_ID=426623 /ORGANISM="Chaetoceros affinis, Strain CCMP159" /LENGTH=197 /DNA_ID=CAMNT_0050548969 /DNA_START=37 /DNA_END=630 /DNA_ORIENTATION=+
MGHSASKQQLPPLQTVPSCITDKFMGPWFVIAVKPTVFETSNSNAVEIYSRNKSPKSSKRVHDIDIDFQYNKAEPITSPLTALNQRGWILGPDKENSSDWNISPFGCIRLHYPIIELDEVNYDYCCIGYSSRNYVWIMSRRPVMDEKVYDMLTRRLVEKHQYTLDGLRKVPQVWTREERKKRNLEAVIPDELLAERA